MTKTISMRGDMYPISTRIFYYLLATLVFWTIFPLLSQISFDSYGDMFENYVWGIRWQWGNDAHPPLFGWTVAAWFELFPRTRLNYWLLAALNLTISLGFMIVIARRFLNERQQDCTLLIALFMPLLGFQAIRYNANAAMLPYWAATIFFYIRLYEKGRLIDAAALGLVAALAMLSKYFSATLIITLFIHAMTVPHIRSMVFGRVGLVATAVFLAVLLPHIIWLIDNDFRPFVFAASEQGNDSISNIIYRQAEFFIGQIVYLLPGFVALAFFRSFHEGLQIFNFSHVPQKFKNPMVAIILWAFVGPIIAAMLIALVMWTPLTSNWSLPIHIVAPLLVVLFLPAEKFELRPWVGPLVFSLFCTVALIASPFLKNADLAKPRGISVMPYEELAQQAEAIWHEAGYDRLLAFGGDNTLTYGMAFSAEGKKQTIFQTNPAYNPWLDMKDFKREALLVICEEANCVKDWQDDGWKLTSLPALQVDALKGAGGPSTYQYYIWAARR
ncbi:glycosyltransferase family 39 protein [Ahrensia kielensis]|uniref:glycosyltransferase family 39 protein n=1 Tax=Ahrensia kielensis TaxID=76980 RepID=UPI0012EAC9FB|nr:glycosyltransferase family 39 protein [Ahrensia kielensis]